MRSDQWGLQSNSSEKKTKLNLCQMKENGVNKSR